MATIADRFRARRARRVRPIAPDRYERVLAWAAMLVLAMTLTALARGQDQWHRVPGFVWAHLVTILGALALTPAMLLRPRGDRLHRRLGWLWCGCLIATAAFSFGIRDTRDGGFSLIHILSVWTLVQVPLIVWSARRHRVETHRNAARGMVTGALVIAGLFTFPFGRMLGTWLFG